MSEVIDIAIKRGSKLHCGACAAFLGLVNRSHVPVMVSLIDGYHRRDKETSFFAPTRYAGERYAKEMWNAERGDKGAARRLKTGRFLPVDHTTKAKGHDRIV